MALYELVHTRYEHDWKLFQIQYTVRKLSSDVILNCMICKKIGGDSESHALRSANVVVIGISGSYSSCTVQKFSESDFPILILRHMPACCMLRFVRNNRGFKKTFKLKKRGSHLTNRMSSTTCVS